MQKKADDWWFGLSPNKRYSIAEAYGINCNFRQARLILYCIESMMSLPEYLMYVANSKNK